MAGRVSSRGATGWFHGRCGQRTARRVATALARYWSDGATAGRCANYWLLLVVVGGGEEVRHWTICDGATGWVVGGEQQQQQEEEEEEEEEGGGLWPIW